jgi:hypothetical protein
VFGEARGFRNRGMARTSWSDAGCPPLAIEWRRVEPYMQHVKRPPPNPGMPLYSNAVVFGPRHGSWIGFDTIEYFETPIAASGWTLRVRDARPSETTGLKRDPELLPLGTMRVVAAVSGARTDELRYTFRRGDDFLGWVTSFFNVPYLFGSAGKGARSQAERYIGADCADLLVAAMRRAGARKLEYTSVAELVHKLAHASPAVELPACDEKAVCTPTSLRFGSDVRPGDLLALDYVGAEELPRDWDHIVAVVEDRGPDGRPDGVLGPEDLVADSGSAEALKFEPLARQGHVRLMVLRPLR